MEQENKPDQKCNDPQSAAILQSEDQGVTVFSPQPFIKTEQILVNECPPVKTEQADMHPGVGGIKCEPDIDYKVEPILLTLKTEPVDPEHLGILPGCDNLEPIGSSFSPSSCSFPQNGELNDCYLDWIYLKMLHGKI